MQDRDRSPRVRAPLGALLMLASGACFDDPPRPPFDAVPTGTDDGTSTTVGDDETTASVDGTTLADGTEPGSSTGDPTLPDGTEGSDSGGSPHLRCPAGVLDAAPLPSTIEASTAEQHDELEGSCGGGSAPEIAYTFTAPADGDYIFDTAGSAIDTVLYVLDGECEGAELRCDDDGLAGTNASVLSLPLVEGQTITAVVDAFGVEGGEVRLTARPGSVECPAQSFGARLPQTLLDQTVVATDRFEPSCGTPDEGDQAIGFVAPQAGIYRFDTAGSDFDTTLLLLDGTCTGPALACNDDEPGTFDGHSGLAISLLAGQAVTAVVEGYLGATGDFALSVDRLEGACPDGDLGAMPVPFAVMGTTVGADEASAGSCGGLGSPDHAYQWTSPATAVYRFDTAGSSFDTVVYLLDGGCLGDELRCNDDAGGPTAAVSAYLPMGQTVVVVVDGAGDFGDFVLSVTETTDSGDCCAPHEGVGCEDLPVQVCVCTLDAFCCDMQWDSTCVDQAIASCDAICV